MKNNFYKDSLYPLQDEVLKIVDNQAKDFFLTGGTALNRFYDGWRYSDDLDFFSLHELKDFRGQMAGLSESLKREGLVFRLESLAESFCRLTLNKNKVELKVDFVNDPVFRYGAIGKFKQFSRVDNEINILTNKLTAISRYEVKDIVDICLIASRRDIDWQEMFKIAEKKSPVDPLDVATVLHKMPKDELKIIRWSKRVDLNKIYKAVQDTAKAIGNG
jgi:predicted nucleotidyltransferase component of viral defense system